MNAFNRLPGFWQWLICMLASVTFCVVFKEGFARMDNESKSSSGRFIGLGIAFGISFGVVFGSAIHNVGAGIAIGIGMGTALGAALGHKTDNSRSR